MSFTFYNKLPFSKALLVRSHQDLHFLLHPCARTPTHVQFSSSAVTCCTSILLTRYLGFLTCGSFSRPVRQEDSQYLPQRVIAWIQWNNSKHLESAWYREAAICTGAIHVVETLTTSPVMRTEIDVNYYRTTACKSPPKCSSRWHVHVTILCRRWKYIGWRKFEHIEKRTVFGVTKKGW